ncbi:beta-N-acetylhexosaminidase [Methylovorus glucosotrophus]|uniref:Beta-hexosaminidase n=1 Tax=Methylovorus glucosotrophus (strain SIP3-4) TaxID=582744 RepID=C6XCE2_METGS|nr:beta-N-acetylhexosaminidase [Methylovorus glucosotrophus]ACT50217.1 glycoside hydrolase family 3 domain protein [Methylovorus glucosotrophus SIP3-4]
MTLGPIMLDVVGTELDAADIRRLQHPLVGGVILFARNYQSPTQLKALTASIHAVRQPPLLIGVDHEGGRVQRFREGFTRIPPMREFGKIWDKQPKKAKQLAEEAGWLMAVELRAHGIDFSFTPVLDMDYGVSQVIGDRAFHMQPQAIAELAYALMQGLKRGGMAAVGKHFPGHGYIAADSHVAIPVDERSFDEIASTDMQPFRQMIDDGLPAIMPAHVIYPKVDDKPAGFSERWLQKVLRQRLAFNGVIFSDDLSMEGAVVAGNVTQRALAALNAGCDMALLCNRPDLADELLENLQWNISAPSLARLARMHGKLHPADMTALRESHEYIEAVHTISQIGIHEDDMFAEAS